jgi:hypothetical protein
LKGLADMANPELDREQSIEEIKIIRESKTKNSTKNGINNKAKSNLVRFK